MLEKPALKDIKIPRLNPTLRLFKAEADKNGAPRWRLYHALSNTYYDIGWAEFEALSRFSACKNAQELKDKIEAETTLELNDEDIPALISFLDKNGLLTSSDAFGSEFKPKKRLPLWKKIVHNYLFFSVPLFKPQGFLKSTWPSVKPLFSKGFFSFSMLVLFIASIMTLGRMDEFLHTFFMFLSLEGVITITVVFFFIKILHELGHAYTAHKYGVDVPHMGLAFIVMYPILYTETTGAWRIESKEKRMAIGLAGIKTELMIAAYALLLWHVLPPGSVLQSLSFSVVAISLIGSLLINLNPLMRFDGYFVFSDYLGIENLHARGFAAFKWALRKTLFGLRDDAPEDDAKRLKFLIYFGGAVLIYRFFLFLGIAILVYHLFFKPLGLFLFLIEIFWFILLPIWGEIKVWIKRRDEITAQRRSKITLGLIGLGLIYLCLPTASTVSLPAISHAQNFASIYPPVAAQIEKIYVSDNQRVNEGDILIKLDAPKLKKDLELAQNRLQALQLEKRQVQSNPAMARERLSTIDIDIKSTAQELKTLEKQYDDLTIRAEFSGIIRDVNKDISEGQFAHQNDVLMRLIQPSQNVVTAFAGENTLHRLNLENTGKFRPHYSLLSRGKYNVSGIDQVNVSSLDYPELSSIYGGPIASEFAPSDQSQIIPRQSLYKIRLTSQNNDGQEPNFSEKGTVLIHGEKEAPIWSYIKAASELIIREINVN